MAGGVSRYRQAYNAGNTGRDLPGGLSSMADEDPLIDSAHDAGRSDTSFEDWQAANGQSSPAPKSSRSRGPAGRRGARGRSSGNLGIRRAARSASVANPTGGRLPIGLTAGAGAAGLFFGAIAYALLLSVVDYGPSGPLLWLKAKFLNEAAGGTGGSSSGGFAGPSTVTPTQGNSQGIGTIQPTAAPPGQSGQFGVDQNGGLYKKVGGVWTPWGTSANPVTPETTSGEV